MGTLIAQATRSNGSNETALANTALWITCTRIPIGIGILSCVMMGLPLAGGVTLTLFVGLDIIDGVIARASHSDDAYRRGLDSVIDRTIVTAFFSVATAQVNAFLAAAAIIAIMNLVTLPFAVSTWRKYRLVFKAPRWHRSWTIILFAAGLLYFNSMITEAVLMAVGGAICMSVCTGSLIYAHVTLGKLKERWTIE